MQRRGFIGIAVGLLGCFWDVTKINKEEKTGTSTKFCDICYAEFIEGGRKYEDIRPFEPGHTWDFMGRRTVQSCKEHGELGTEAYIAFRTVIDQHIITHETPKDDGIPVPYKQWKYPDPPPDILFVPEVN